MNTDVCAHNHAQMRLQITRRDRELAKRRGNTVAAFYFVTRGGTPQLETSEWWMIVTILVNLFHGQRLE